MTQRRMSIERASTLDQNAREAAPRAIPMQGVSCRVS